MDEAAALEYEVEQCVGQSATKMWSRGVLRLAVNRLGEKGQWNLDALKIELEELIVIDAPIEIMGFSPTEIDQIVLGEGPRAVSRSRAAKQARTQAASFRPAANVQVAMISSPTYLWISPPASAMASDRSVTKRLALRYLPPKASTAQSNKFLLS